jgi:hypothetical protein
MTILERNNVDDLFRQKMIEFIQTDIDGSVDFLLNAITIQSLERYLKTFYMPPLDIDQIPFIWVKFFVIQKQWSLLLKKYGNVQGK